MATLGWVVLIALVIIALATHLKRRRREKLYPRPFVVKDKDEILKSLRDYHKEPGRQPKDDPESVAALERIRKKGLL